MSEQNNNNLKDFLDTLSYPKGGNGGNGGGVSSWNDLTDKPFGEYVPEPIVWDGNTDGLEQGPPPFTSIYKISDKSVSWDEMIGATVSVNAKEITISEDMLTDFGVQMGLAEHSLFMDENGMYFMVVMDDIHDPASGLTMHKGFYVPEGFKSLTFPESTKTVKKLDEKYLPDNIGGGVSSWNDLKDKPFGEESGEVVLFKGTVVDGDTLNIKGLLELGKDYIVVYDGTTYNLVAVDDEGFTTIGALYSSDFSEYDFSIYNDNGEVCVALVDSNEHSLRISAMGQVIKPIDEKYMPESIKSGAFVLRPTIEELSKEGSRIVCTTQYDEMAKALEAGGHVSIVFPPAFFKPDVSVPVMISVNMWAVHEGLIICGLSASGEIYDVTFTNGTYLPQL